MCRNCVRSVDAQCHGCRHQVILNVVAYPSELRVRRFGAARSAEWPAPVSNPIGRNGRGDARVMRTDGEAQ